jgi:phosphate transport system protein
MPGRKVLDELNELHREFLELGTWVEELVAGGERAIRAPDAPPPVFGWERELDERGRGIVERCRRIVLLYQPVAVDFREVTAVLRMAAELGHIGHLAAETVERAAALAALPVPAPEELHALAALAAGVVRNALGADAEPHQMSKWSAPGVRTERAGLAGALTAWLARVMRADPTTVEPGLALFALFQSLQRIVEHGLALAEEVAFLNAPCDAPPAARDPAGARSGS